MQLFEKFIHICFIIIIMMAGLIDMEKYITVFLIALIALLVIIISSCQTSSTTDVVGVKPIVLPSVTGDSPIKKHSEDRVKKRDGGPDSILGLFLLEGVD